MTQLTPLFADDRKAAELFCMKPREFRKLVDEGHLPPPRSMGGIERWDVEELRQIRARRGYRRRGHDMVNRWGGKRFLIEPKPGFVYVRKRGRYIGRITAPYPSAEFDRQYWDILTGRSTEATTSLRAFIASSRKSDRWAGLKPRTRTDYEKILTYIEETNGARDATRATRKDWIAAMEAMRCATTR